MASLLEFLGYEDHGVQWELFHDGYEFFFVEMTEKPAGVFVCQGTGSGIQSSQCAGRFVADWVFYQTGDGYLYFFGDSAE